MKKKNLVLQTAAAVMGTIIFAACGASAALNQANLPAAGRATAPQTGVSATSQQAIDEARIVELKEFTGTVKVKSGREEEEAYKGQHLRVGEVLKTGKTSVATLILDDEKVIALDEETEVEVREASGSKKASTTVLFLNRGTIVNSLPKLEAQSAYEVKTSNATMGVRGTVFIVSLQNGATTLAVADGRVAAGPPEATEEELTDTLTVGGMQQVSLDDNALRQLQEGKTPPVQPLRTGDFSVQTLQNVVRALAEHRDSSGEEQQQKELQNRINQIILEVPEVKQNVDTGTQNWFQPQGGESGASSSKAEGASSSKSAEGGYGRQNTAPPASSSNAQPTPQPPAPLPPSPSSSQPPSSSSGSSSQGDKQPLDVTFLSQFSITSTRVFYETQALSQPARYYQMDIVEKQSGRSVLPEGNRVHTPSYAGEVGGKPVYALRFEQVFSTPLAGEYIISLKAVAGENTPYKDSETVSRGFTILGAPALAGSRLLPNTLEVAAAPVPGAAQYEVSLLKNGQAVYGPMALNPQNPASPSFSIALGKLVQGPCTLRVAALPGAGVSAIKSGYTEVTLDNTQAFPGVKQGLYLDYWRFAASQSQLAAVQAAAVLPAGVELKESDFALFTKEVDSGTGTLTVKKADGGLLCAATGPYTLYLRTSATIYTFTENITNLENYKHSIDLSGALNAINITYNNRVTLTGFSLPDSAALSDVRLSLEDSFGLNWENRDLTMVKNGSVSVLSYTGTYSLYSNLYTLTLTANSTNPAYKSSSVSKQVDLIQTQPAGMVSMATASTVVLDAGYLPYALDKACVLLASAPFDQNALVAPSTTGMYPTINGSFTPGQTYRVYVSVENGSTMALYKSANFTIPGAAPLAIAAEAEPEVETEAEVASPPEISESTSPLPSSPGEGAPASSLIPLL